MNWIPWDNNESLKMGKESGAISLSLSEVGEDWPLIRCLIDDSEYKQIYEAYMFQFINEVFTSDKMLEIYTNYYNLLKEYAYVEEPGYTFLRSDRSFDSAVNTLKSHVQNRIQAVESYLK